MNKLKWFFYKFFQRILLALPQKSGYMLASILGELVYFFSFQRKKNVLFNLSRVMKNDSLQTRKKTAKRMFVNFAKYLVDFLCAQRITEDYIERNVDFIDFDRLLQLGYHNKGIILLTAHLGNWEIGGGIVSLCVEPIYAVAFPHSDEKINIFFNNQRELMKIRIISLNTAARNCFLTLKNKKMLALLGDRDFSGHGQKVKMFNSSVFVPRGPALLADKLKVPVLPAFLLRKADDRYQLMVDEIIYPQASGESLSEEEILNKCVEVIEKYIRLYPDQWFMFDRYFED